MEMNYLTVIKKDGVKAESYIKSFEILERFLKIELPNGICSFVNIDVIETFHVTHKED